jgi:hypothetical protein
MECLRFSWCGTGRALPDRLTFAATTLFLIACLLLFGFSDRTLAAPDTCGGTAECSGPEVSQYWYH